MARRTRICLVGAGRMGQQRARIFYANPRSMLVCVVDPYRPSGERIAELYGIDYYETFAQVDKTKIDALAICTSTSTHADLITAAAQSGLAVFCEKPIDSDILSIRNLFRVCRESKVALCCGFQRRFDESYVKLRNAVVSGRIGKPVMVRVFFADHPAPPLEFLKLGGDPFMDLAPHDLDFVRWCLQDEPAEVHGTASSSLPEYAEHGILDTAMMTIKFQSGCMCNIFMSRASTYGYDQRCEIFGTKGMISLENQPNDSCVLSTNDGIESAKYLYSFPERFRLAFENEINCFLDTCLDGKQWSVTEEDCIAAQKIAATASLSNIAGKILSYEVPDTEHSSYPEMLASEEKAAMLVPEVPS